MKTAAVLVAATIAVAVVHPGSTLAQKASERGQGAADPRAIAGQVDAAIKSGDESALADALNKLWSADAKMAAGGATALLTRGSDPQRLIAAASIARHADPAAIAKAARSLNTARAPDERRLLVRALGASSDAAGASREARAFLKDSDSFVRAAAVSALADLRAVDAVNLIIADLPPYPDTSTDRNPEFVLAMQRYGALRSLTGQSFRNQTEASDWARTNAASLEPGVSLLPPATPADARPDAQGRMRTARFNVSFKTANLQADAKAFGLPDWPKLASELDAAAARGLNGAERIFGPVHLPAIDLALCDRNQIASEGGQSSSYAGFAMGTKVTTLLDKLDKISSVTAHEMVHVAHQAHYTSQPRWLSEGLAISATLSETSSAWLGARRRPDPKAVEAVQKGAFTTLVGWESDGYSGADAHLYQLAHMAVDYLRFGGFVEPEPRLAALMGRLSRGQTGAQALQSVYGKDLRALDAGLREWLEGKSR